MIEVIFRQQYQMNVRALHTNLSGISEEQALWTMNGSASMNWIVGHMLRSRSDTLEEAGAKRLHEENQLLWYRPFHEAEVRESSPFSLRELVTMLDDSTEAFLSSILEQLSKTPNPDREHVLRRIAFRSFHESYHCGQIAVLRRALGLEGMIK